MYIQLYVCISWYIKDIIPIQKVCCNMSKVVFSKQTV